MRQKTAKSMSMMFSSPVSIIDSSVTLREGFGRTLVALLSAEERKPMSMRLMRVTRGVVTLSIGQGRW